MGSMTSAAAITASAAADTKLANPAALSASSFVDQIEDLLDKGLRSVAADDVRTRDDLAIRHGMALRSAEQNTKDRTHIDRLVALMLDGNKKIEAIKEYRSLTGVGLKEAKDAVESLLEGRVLPSVGLPSVQSTQEGATAALRSAIGFLAAGDHYDAIVAIRNAFGLGHGDAQIIVEGLIDAGHEAGKRRERSNPSAKPKEYLVFRKDDTESYMDQWIRAGVFKDEFGSEAKGDAIHEATVMAERGVEGILVVEVIGKTVPVFKEI